MAIGFSVIVSALNYLLVRHMMMKLKKMAEHHLTVNLVHTLNNYTDSPIPSTQLLPGDVFTVQSGMKLPCDAILFDGEALLNEASLTGESVPVAKYSLPPTDDLKFSYAKCQK